MLQCVTSLTESVDALLEVVALTGGNSAAVANAIGTERVAQVALVAVARRYWEATVVVENLMKVVRKGRVEAVAPCSLLHAHCFGKEGA
jgi:hypothetical protein